MVRFRKNRIINIIICFSYKKVKLGVLRWWFFFVFFVLCYVNIGEFFGLFEVFFIDVWWNLFVVFEFDWLIMFDKVGDWFWIVFILFLFNWECCI